MILLIYEFISKRHWAKEANDQRLLAVVFLKLLSSETGEFGLWWQKSGKQLSW